VGLSDLFRRAPARVPESDSELWRRVGRLEADVETLQGLKLSWADYRDQLHRLVNRLEKRDQRAAAAAEPRASDQPHMPLTQVERARLLRARRRGT